MKEGKRKIKVLRIINRFNLGGPSFNAAYLSKYLEPEYETLLIGGVKYEEEESSEFILEKLGVKPIIIPEMRRKITLRGDLTAYKKIKKIIKEYKPDIVHTHAAKAGALGRYAASVCNVPIIIHTFHGHVFHSYFGKGETLFYKMSERKLAKRSTKIVAISDIQKEELGKHHKICDPDKIAMIPLGFDLSKFQENLEEKRQTFRTKYKIADDEVAIAIIGRLVPIKNHPLFINAIKELKNKTNKKIRAFLVGDGEDKNKLIELLKRIDLDYVEWNSNETSATVTLTSWIKDMDLVYAGMDVITLTSLNEETPVTLIEAQASNKPIVTTDVGGVRNIVLKDETAFVEESGDIEGIVGSLLKLVEDKELRKKMGEKGWDFVKKEFHYKRLVNDMKKLYDSLTNNN